MCQPHTLEQGSLRGEETAAKQPPIHAAQEQPPFLKVIWVYDRANRHWLRMAYKDADKVIWVYDRANRQWLRMAYSDADRKYRFCSNHRHGRDTRNNRRSPSSRCFGEERWSRSVRTRRTHWQRKTTATSSASIATLILLVTEPGPPVAAAQQRGCKRKVAAASAIGAACAEPGKGQASVTMKMVK